MNKKIQFNKGSIVPVLILVVLIIAGGIWYAVNKKGIVNTNASTITLVSPNGGENLTIGQPITVTFVTTGEIKDGYKVVIWLEEGAAPLATISATTTSYTFTVPESVLIGGDAVAPLEPGSYKIRVALYDGTPCTGFCLPSDVKELATDSSDGMITVKKVLTQPVVQSSVSSTQPSITVLSPKIKDIFKFGEKVIIKWNDSSGKDLDNYTIALVDSNLSKVVSTIASNVSIRSSGVDGTSLFEWTVTNVAAGKYKIEVYRGTARELTGRSGEFTITN